MRFTALILAIAAGIVMFRYVLDVALLAIDRLPVDFHHPARSALGWGLTTVALAVMAGKREADK